MFKYLILLYFVFGAFSLKRKEDFLIKQPILKDGNRSIGYSGLIYLESLCADVFFWYVPISKRNQDKAPVFIWLPEKNYDSGIYSFLEEVTPFFFKTNGSYEHRGGTISEDYPVLLLDLPLGVGFSQRNKGCKLPHLDNLCFHDGFAKSQCGISYLFREFMQAFERIFKEEMSNGFYLGGKNYAGKYAISIAHELISKHDTNLNLKGLILQAPLIDPILQSASYPMTMLYTGFATTKEFVNLNSIAASIMINNALEKYSKVLEMYTSYMDRIVESAQEYSQIGDISKIKRDSKLQFYYELLNKDFIKESLNIPLERKFANDQHGSAIFKNDTIRSVTDQTKEVLKYCKVFIFQGQFSMINNVPGYFSILKQLDSTFLNSPREIILENNRTAGYTYRHGSLLFMVVLRGGWSVILGKRKLVSKIVDGFFG